MSLLSKRSYVPVLFLTLAVVASVMEMQLSFALSIVGI